MIINKTNHIFSFIKVSMFNLQEYQFSNVTKKETRSSSTLENKKTVMLTHVQCQKLNLQEKKQKKKVKTIIPDPIQTYQMISEWRKTHIAPVDTMGCDRLSESNQAQQTQKYQTLIALMLSVQTTDQITSMVVKRLQEYGLTPNKIAATSEQKLVQLIYQANFNKRKAKNIIQVSKLVLENGLPRKQQDLLKLPGVGVKISMIYLRSAEGLLYGIGVDTHVHRISNKLGWVKTSNPNQTEKQLQQVFPKQYWKSINIDLVGFGQILCNAKKPLCKDCPVNNQCPSSEIMQTALQW